MKLSFTVSPPAVGRRRAKLARVLAVSWLCLLGGTAYAQQPVVTGLLPARNARSAARTTDIAVTFSQTLSTNAATQQALKVFSAQAGGQKAGTATVSGNTLRFDPSAGFKAGETVFATITSAAQSTSGAAVAPHLFQFTTATTPSAGIFAADFNLVDDSSVSELADVDADGDLDLIGAASGTIKIRRNNGQGNFAGTATTVGASTSTIVKLLVGDVDRDGDLDLIATGNNAVTIALNKGDGTFTTALVLNYSPFAYDSALGDIDVDGDLDVLVANDTGVTLLRNNGSGSFTADATRPVVGTAFRVAVGDLDSDGDLDLLAATDYTGTISVRLNDGQGTFSTSPSFASDVQVMKLTLGDVDADGDLDMLATGYTSGIAVRLNNGQGSFSPTQTINAGFYIKGTALGDVDGDGDLDVAAVGYTALTGSALQATILLNTGAGTYTKGQDFSVGGSPSNLLLGDVDSDGDLDLAITNLITDVGLLVRLNQPLTITALSPARNARSAPRNTDVAVTFDQTLSTSTATQQSLKVFSQQASGKKAGIATVSDNTLSFNPDKDFKAGETVFATVTSAAQSSSGTPVPSHVFQFTIATSPSTGRFGLGSEVPVSSPNDNPYSIATGDVDDDGDLDLLTANQGSNTVSVRLNNGSGTFSGNQEVAVGSAPLTLVLGDVDGDGDLDFATANGLNPTANGTISIRLNNGNGTFSGGQEIITGVRFNGYGNGLALNDMDGDGDLDVVTSYPRDQSSTTGVTAVRLNNGDGTFSGGAELVTITPFPKDIAVGDVDSDGDLDILTANAVDVSVRLNNGFASFTGNQQVTVGFGPAELALGDLDGNGTLDLVTANNNNTLSIRLNTNGIFGGTLNLPLARGPLNLALGDVDGDNDLDIVIVRKEANGAEIYLNAGNATFTTGQVAAVGLSPYAVALGDLDNDGTLDLLTANYVGQTVSVRLNKTVLANAPAQLAEQVSVYPNPAHASAWLQLPTALSKQGVQVNVLNTLGQTVLSRQFEAAEAANTPALPLGTLAAGLYMVQLRTSAGLITKRLAVK